MKVVVVVPGREDLVGRHTGLVLYFPAALLLLVNGFGATPHMELTLMYDAARRAMAASGVTAVLLPGTSFFLMKNHYAPARRLIQAGVPVALDSRVIAPRVAFGDSVAAAG